ncbi:MAG: hypothetical protein JWO91_1903 [Acidobacteriaceae bacterium]|nr:hypothetical protein [Acidobacteriaceae bacterium]
MNPRGVQTAALIGQRWSAGTTLPRISEKGCAKANKGWPDHSIQRVFIGTNPEALVPAARLRKLLADVWVS